MSASCDRAVGRWDQRFFLYSEETDDGARARAAGFRVEYLPAARARHRGGGSGQSNAQVALNAVNRVRYMEKRRQWPRAYRAAVVLHMLLRSSDSGHRTALRFVLRRSSWPTLGADLKRPSAVVSAVPGILQLPERQQDVQTSPRGGTALAKLAIITPSYAPDFELCRDLNASVLAHTPASTQHYVIYRTVTSGFPSMRGPRTQVWSVDQLLPRYVIGVPRSNFWVNLRRPVRRCAAG